MCETKLRALKKAFRQDLQAIINGTYVPPRPHPVLGNLDEIDQQVDAAQKQAA